MHKEQFLKRYSTHNKYIYIYTERGSTSRQLEFELEAEANEKKKKGMVLPFAPLSLTFNDIVYSVDMPSVHLLFN